MWAGFCVCVCVRAVFAYITSKTINNCWWLYLLCQTHLENGACLRTLKLCLWMHRIFLASTVYTTLQLHWLSHCSTMRASAWCLAGPLHTKLFVHRANISAPTAPAAIGGRLVDGTKKAKADFHYHCLSYIFVFISLRYRATWHTEKESWLVTARLHLQTLHRIVVAHS